MAPFHTPENGAGSGINPWALSRCLLPNCGTRSTRKKKSRCGLKGKWRGGGERAKRCNVTLEASSKRQKMGGTKSGNVSRGVYGATKNSTINGGKAHQRTGRKSQRGKTSSSEHIPNRRASYYSGGKVYAGHYGGCIHKRRAGE